MEAAMIAQMQQMAQQGAVGQATTKGAAVNGATANGTGITQNAMFASLLQQMLGMDGETAILGSAPQQKAMLVEQMRQQLSQDGAEMGMQLLADMLAVNPSFVQQVDVAELMEMMQSGTTQPVTGVADTMQNLWQTVAMQNENASVLPQMVQQSTAQTIAQQAVAQQGLAALTQQVAMPEAQLVAALTAQVQPEAKQAVTHGADATTQILMQQAKAGGAAVQVVQGATEGAPAQQQELSDQAQFQRAMFTAQQGITREGKSDAAEVLAVQAEEGETETKKVDNVIAFPQQTKLAQLEKTAQLLELGEIDAKDILQQIKTGITKGAADGKNEFVIKLKPEGLGEITVRMMEEAGKITLSLTTSNTQTQRMLNNELAALRDAVRPYNVEVHNVESQNTQHFDLHQQRQQSGQSQQQQQAQRDGRPQMHYGGFDAEQGDQPELMQQYRASTFDTVV